MAVSAMLHVMIKTQTEAIATRTNVLLYITYNGMVRRQNAMEKIEQFFSHGQSIIISPQCNVRYRKVVHGNT
jgi:hypothetical protein